MAVMAAPIFASLLGAGLSSSGSKKAAKGAKPQVPQVLQGVFGDAQSLLRSRLQGGFPRFGGSFVAQSSPGQSQFLGQGQAGLNSALQTQRNIAETGLSEEQLKVVTDSFQPLFKQQRRELVGEVREGEAQGGRFFSKGATTSERTALTDLKVQQSGQILPLALQATGLQAQTAQGLPDFLNRANQTFDFPRQLEQMGLDKNFAEFLRTQPENALGMLQSILGGSGVPLFVPPQGTNFGQAAGANLSQLGATGLGGKGGGAGKGNKGTPASTNQNSFFGGGGVFDTGGAQ